MNVYYAPDYPEIYDDKRISIFLAGTIDQGNSHNWQNDFMNVFQDWDIDIYNPRRPHWNTTIDPTLVSNELENQVNWELDHLECSDLIVMRLLSSSLSPISLFEFGLFLGKRDIIVYCEEGFWRKGNVDIICDRYNIECHYNEMEFYNGVIDYLNRLRFSYAKG